MDLVVPDDHTPVREVIIRVLARLLSRPRRGVRPGRHAAGRPAAPEGLHRVGGHGPGGTAPAVPDVPAVAAPPAPAWPPARARHLPPLPLTPAPGESLEDVAQALADAHHIRVSRLSSSDIWSCQVCHAAGFGADIDAALDHAQLIRRQAAEKAAAAAVAEQTSRP